VITLSRSLDPITSHICVAVGLPGPPRRKAASGGQVLLPHASRSTLGGHMSCTGILIVGVFLPTAGATIAALRGGWFGGVAGVMLGFGISYAVVTGAWKPEAATSGAPARPATGAALGPRTVGNQRSASDTRGTLIRR